MVGIAATAVRPARTPIKEENRMVGGRAEDDGDMDTTVGSAGLKRLDAPASGLDIVQRGRSRLAGGKAAAVRE